MALDDILAQVPIDDIAEKLGVSRDEAKVAVEQGGAVLLGGLAKNAETEEGSAAIQNALKKHSGTTGAAKVDDIDQADGGKIVAHILGSKEKQVTKELTESKATPGIDFGKLLPILAPIVMGLIANASKDKTSKAETGGESSGGIGDVIGGILGGGNGGSSGGIGDVIGGLLGGGSSSSGGGIDLGGILGGLFGGKK
ncbi:MULTISPECIES: DUF937 domain-containing protein [unclassified Microbacterium]|uniref:DUF937 domain-containing protein n=1 Tax=unclassified Microbacterium TaxID=2609290 RepID=UPI001604ED15|nr:MULTISPECIES: DUF937 domain-containing protein [unclassified Microbacterium]QNA91794.1 DUF937 domain-containing protein [Microbacterium sp. Se63.02b]QYM64995.1 DUF937 domain-containing protein [Microbacterium sp. Se5.02b]